MKTWTDPLHVFRKAAVEGAMPNPSGRETSSDSAITSPVSLGRGAIKKSVATRVWRIHFSGNLDCCLAFNRSGGSNRGCA